MKTEKKLIAALASLCLLTGLAACGGSTASTSTPAPKSQETTSSQPEEKKDDKKESTDQSEGGEYKSVSDTRNCYTPTQIKKGAMGSGLASPNFYIFYNTVDAQCFIPKSGTITGTDAAGNPLRGTAPSVTIEWTGERKDGTYKAKSAVGTSTSTVQYVAEKVNITPHDIPESLMADELTGGVYSLKLHAWYENDTGGRSSSLYGNATFTPDVDAFLQAAQQGDRDSQSGLSTVKFESDKPSSVWVVSTMTLTSSGTSETNDPYPVAMDALICYSNACVVSDGNPLG